MEAFNDGSIRATDEWTTEMDKIRSLPMEERSAALQRRAELRERKKEEERKRQETLDVYKEKLRTFRRGPMHPLSVLVGNEREIEERMMMAAVPSLPKGSVPHKTLRQHQVVKTVGTEIVNHHSEILEADSIRLLNALQSKDPIEAMIDGLIVASNNVAMKMLERTARTTKPQSVAASASGAVKLINACAELIRLRDQRAAGPQTITVNEVKVEAGGQAIVGNVQNRRGSRDA